MKKLIDWLISCLLLGSFNLYAQNVAEIEKSNLQKLAAQSVRFRLEVLINQDLLDKMYASDRPLTSYDINVINKKALERFQFGQKALRFLNHYKRQIKEINPRKDKNQLEEVKNTLTAFALANVMSDSYLFSYSQFNEHKKLRRLLNESDPSIQKQKMLFRDSLNEFYSAQNRRQFNKAKKIFQNIYLANKQKFASYPVLQVAEDLITQSFTYQQLLSRKHFAKTQNFFDFLGDSVHFSFQKLGDAIALATEGVLYQASKLFGNTAGLVQWRRGKLFKAANFLKDAATVLQPLDVVLEKTPFRLTDSFIPGYWGHTGIYVGTKSDLLRLGIYQHPVVTPYHKEIDAGATIVEALRPGVQFNSLEHFSDIDDFAIIRLRVPLDLETQKQYILRAFAQVGKRYDFSFNIESCKTIVCSELHYRVFENVPFRTKKIFGRYTIDVDQVAQMGLTGQPFEPMLLYLKGHKIPLKDNQTTYDGLINNQLSQAPVAFLKDYKELSDIFKLMLRRY